MLHFDTDRLLAIFDRVHDEVLSADLRPEMLFQPVAKPSRRIYPILYIPVEVKARELQARILLARDAVDRGLSVILGPVWTMHPWAEHLPKGIVLFKSLNATDAKNMVWWIRHGHMVAAQDEEVYGVEASRDYLTATTHPQAAALADVVFAQGPAYAQAFPFPVPLHIAGNLRTQTYKTARGHDILVCLQSGNINNNGRSFEEMIRRTLELGPPSTSAPGRAWAQILRSSIAHECNLLPLVQSSIAALAEAFPDKKIVVRPHPVEDPSRWTFPHRNIVLDKSGNVTEAIATSNVVVYVSGCTTGLDAYLAHAPAVRLGSGGHGISARMHTPVDTSEAAVSAVRARALWQGDIGAHLASGDFITPLIALHKMNAMSGEPGHFPILHATSNEFTERKFPTTSVKEMSALVERNVRELSWNTFLITRN